MISPEVVARGMSVESSQHYAAALATSPDFDSPPLETSRTAIDDTDPSCMLASPKNPTQKDVHI